MVPGGPLPASSWFKIARKSIYNLINVALVSLEDLLTIGVDREDTSAANLEKTAGDKKKRVGFGNSLRI